jgi:hypothetical protein
MTKRSRVEKRTDLPVYNRGSLLIDRSCALNYPIGEEPLWDLPNVHKDYYKCIGHLVELVYNLEKGTPMEYGHWVFRPRTDNVKE